MVRDDSEEGGQGVGDTPDIHPSLPVPANKQQH